MQTRSCVGAILVLAILTAPLQAQRESWIPPGTALGVTVDRFMAGERFLDYSATFHVSDLQPGKLTPEFGAGVFARSLAAQSVISNIDVGAAFNVPLPRATLLLRGGASGLFAFGRAQGALPGAHYGASLLLKLGGRDGLRIDVIRRIYLVPSDYFPTTLTIGVGITSLPSL